MHTGTLKSHYANACNHNQHSFSLPPLIFSQLFTPHVYITKCCMCAFVNPAFLAPVPQYDHATVHWTLIASEHELHSTQIELSKKHSIYFQLRIEYQISCRRIMGIPLCTYIHTCIHSWVHIYIVKYLHLHCASFKCTICPVGNFKGLKKKFYSTRLYGWYNIYDKK